ncbi:MAG TPA: HAMP domain-containing sensor histidine kinase [Tepidisphaeraceae bacterium]|nr:HAMP domain-containing sensor histidine kinase [Tepidisphaeraceae bacterium]
MDLLKYRAFPELAAALRQRAAGVIARWLEVVHASLPAVHELTLREVRNSLPETLGIMADALEADDPRATKTLMDQAVCHGESRFDQNLALNELMIEYGLLRPILIEEIAEQLDRAISTDEMVALNLAVDVALRRGVTSYVNQQKADLQQLVEAQTKYLSFLSHDLRGNLNGVLLMIEVLHRDLEAEPKFEGSLNDLDVMRRSILDTVSTMDRFLHAERFRRGKVQVKPAKVDLCALVGDVVGQFAYQAREKGLEILGEARDGATVISDRELLGMILQNLVGNSVKYAQRGSVRIVAGPDGPEHAARVSVIDQGPGIDPTRLSQLFQPYSRGETHGQEGTGLGLSIARAAADLLGAKLWAESEPGKGSAFHLDLPAEPPGIAVQE